MKLNPTRMIWRSLIFCLTWEGMRFSRLCLVVAAVSWMFSAALLAVYLAIIEPTSMVFTGMIALALAKKRRYIAASWTHGTAAFITPSEAIQADLCSGKPGLLIGKIPAPPIRQAWRELLRLRTRSDVAVTQFFAALSRKDLWVTLPHSIHSLIVSRTGGGKGVSFLLPFLMRNPDSAIVFDPKGEAATLTAAIRRKMGHRVVLLDPFHVVTDTPDVLNPLDGISGASPHLLDLARSLAEAIVVREKGEKEPHFNDSAVMWLTAIIALTLMAGNGVPRDLNTVATTLARPEELAAAISAMAGNRDLCAGMLGRIVSQLQHFVDREKGSTLTTVARHLTWLNSPAVAASVSASSFSPRDLRSQPVTVYCILPAHLIDSHRNLVRVWLTTMINAVIEQGVGEKRLVHVICDEMGAVGHLRALETALNLGRGFSLRVQMYMQGLAQLEHCFPEQSQTILGNVTQVFFGVNDFQTAEYISKRLGEFTTVYRTSSTGGNKGRSLDNHGHDSMSSGSNTGINENRHARALLQPGEVLNLGDQIALIFSPGLPPLLTRLARCYQRGFRSAPHLGQRRRRFLALHCLLIALFSVAVPCLMLAPTLTKSPVKPVEQNAPAKSVEQKSAKSTGATKRR
ncbi:type IV secretory system conjugative DNA transfer family protein [Zavarzinella formosa]|uniref:type IV secretory system conjugative DNA transfer family protein n=1 Tax=Zavarzinella formosa TaxID=360055 RepID=UPI000378B50E|nr:type IV secretory system conjugative DNA transfer family protein [Zavarzinella formosa]